MKLESLYKEAFNETVYNKINATYYQYEGFHSPKLKL